MKDCLTMNISYFMKDRSFKITGEINENGQFELLENILLGGKFDTGKDHREANKREEYDIQINWYPYKDRFEISDNTGNYGLRNGILMDVFIQLKV